LGVAGTAGTLASMIPGQADAPAEAPPARRDLETRKTSGGKTGGGLSKVLDGAGTALGLAGTAGTLASMIPGQEEAPAEAPPA
jgi:hypothetical protein